jgi:hypothetical protein
MGAFFGAFFGGDLDLDLVLLFFLPKGDNLARDFGTDLLDLLYAIYIYMYCFNSKLKKIPLNEIRIIAITSFSNTINTQNEGAKHGDYNRFLLKKKKTNMCLNTN